MKRKTRFWSSHQLIRLLSPAALLFSVTFLLTSCFLKQDRTTIVYGTVTDQHGQPVDSILVIVQGSRYLTYEDLGRAYSKENGSYEIVTEVPKRFTALNSGIPSFPLENRKFEKYYKGYGVQKDGKPTSSCCFSTIGEKTRYDFQLIPR